MTMLLWTLLAAFTLHNLEEILTLRSRAVGPFRAMERGPFAWATALLTLLMLAFVALATLQGAGSVGAFLGVVALASVGLNGLFHVAAAFRYRRYVPGLATAAILGLPLTAYGAAVAYRSGYLSADGLLGATAVAAGLQVPLILAALAVGRRLASLTAPEPAPDPTRR